MQYSKLLFNFTLTISNILLIFSKLFYCKLHQSRFICWRLSNFAYVFFNLKVPPFSHTLNGTWFRLNIFFSFLIFHLIILNLLDFLIVFKNRTFFILLFVENLRVNLLFVIDYAYNIADKGHLRRFWEQIFFTKFFDNPKSS